MKFAIRGLELGVGDSGLRSARSGGLYRLVVIVDTDEFLVREGFGHQYRAGSMTAADIRCSCS